MKNIFSLIAILNFSLFFAQTCNPCDEVFDGGIVCCDQGGYEGLDVAPLLSNSPADFGGTIVYKWYKSTVNEPWATTNPNWQAIPNSNSENYNPGQIWVTTYYYRLAKKSGCPKFKGISNKITVNIGVDPCKNKFHGGTIASNQSGAMPFQASTITSTLLPNPGSLGIAVEYIWMWSHSNTNWWSGGWNVIPGATGTTYTPGVLNQTTYFIRLSRAVGCEDWNGESNVITIEVVTPTPSTSCLIYAVHDEGQSTWSQLFTIDPFNGYTVALIGGHHDGMDLEGLEMHPTSGVLYGSSGNDNTYGLSGHFYALDAVTGVALPIGPTGYDDVVDLTFHPLTHVLYAWVDDYGLITIDLSTGAGTMVLPSGMDMDGLTFSNDGTLLYGFDHDELFSINLANGAINLLTTIFAGHNIEALEIRPDGKLMFGVHNSSTNSIYILDPITLQVISSEAIATPFNDIEGIVWPNNCNWGLSVAIEHTTILCNGNSSNVLTIVNGNGPYTYVWSNGATTADLSNVPAGNYTVVVTDATGSSTSASVSITQPTFFDAIPVVTNPPCDGSICNGAIQMNVTGGVAPYTYLWSTGATTPSISNLCANWYWYDIYDANGCLIKKDITLDCQTVLSAIDTPVISASPMPATPNSEINLTVEYLPIGKYTVTLHSTSGAVILKDIQLNVEFSSKVTSKINLDNISSGIYMIEVSGNGVSYFEKLLVH